MAMLDYSKRNIRAMLLNSRYFYKFFSLSGINLISFLLVTVLLATFIALCITAISFSSITKTTKSCDLIGPLGLLIAGITAIFSLLSPILTFFLIRITRKDAKRSEARAILALEQSRFESKLSLIDNFFQLIITLTGATVADNASIPIIQIISLQVENIDKAIDLYDYNNDNEEILFQALIENFDYYDKVFAIRSEICKICENDKQLKSYASFKFQAQFMNYLEEYISEVSLALDALGKNDPKHFLRKLIALYRSAKFD